ncbi:MAG: hypothetical protein J6Q43_02755 [Bacteroidaceae bacterium]|nr:hypothetical protein [Bacteroidaceae bacterium]MBO5885666.1 hypothetical protein [Bacteroidaceae bacterium]
MKTKTLLSICVMGLLTPCTHAQTMFQVNEDFPCPHIEKNVGDLNHQNESLSDIKFNKKSEKISEIIISDRYKRYVSDEVIPLSEVQNYFCAKLDNRPLLYMVNKFFITKNIERYKIDKKFIYKVEALHSEDIHPLKNIIQKPFTIIRIFTKTHHNWHPHNASIRETDSIYLHHKKELNHQLEFLTDIEFNNPKNGLWCYMYENEYLGPQGAVCFDRKDSEQKSLSYPFTIKGLGIQVTTDWETQPDKYKIAENPILGFINYTSKTKKELLSLDEIKNRYCGQVKDKDVIYMINKFFITNNVNSYKIDKDFIYKVENLPGTDFPALKGLVKPQFTIIRIFTKTRHNWHSIPVGK